ncbi:ATP-binding protein [Actinoplanes sp. NPDC051346]|uniref:ATP-binding protein n=1 Tax=Actinoplanes sp. NPDC051346 TaxID=3155048 RepID=UPI00342830F1
MAGLFWHVRTRVSSTGLAAIIAVVIVAATLAVASALAVGQRRSAEAQVERRAAQAADAVAAEAGRYVDTLRTVAASAGAFEPLTAAAFRQAVAPLKDMNLAGATSIAFLVPATDDQVPSVQARWRSRGVPDLRVKPVGTGVEHLLAVLSVPLDGASTPRLGIDASQAVAPARALTEARRSGAVTISAAYQLIIDQNVPADQRQMSFSLTAPVYAPADAAGQREFRGWLLMGLRGHDFIAKTLHQEAQGLIDVSLRAEDVGGREAPVAALDAPVTGRRDLTRTVSVPVADRYWHLRVDAAGASLPGVTTGLPTVITVSGVILGLLLAGLVWVLATGRARARAEVKHATAELATAEADARRQAELLGAVLDGISDGVGVVDHQGEFLLHNPAAKAILGLGVDKGGVDNWQDHYGIFEPDTITPFPTPRLPLVRALAGESVDQVEMVIRNPAQPDGVTITVSARPLSGAGQGAAVAVFHDISARKLAEAQLAATVTELREREADLRAFAGVVAHDLKAPLSVVAGYAEFLDEALATGAPSTALRPTLHKVHSGVARMSRLIDDLLAYATARDGVLQPATVDLQTLTADVITGRTAHLRGNPAIAFPDIYTGSLPTVHADPVLVRQLLDNLIGNALKYTLPGQPARIDIAARDDAPGWTRIEIADRGIGIPAAEHDQVFERFHRSAAHSSYTGTGLGLAICKKVIERHGGRIHAEDNPGGGIRIIFTLPVHAHATEASPRRLEPHLCTTSDTQPR